MNHKLIAVVFSCLLLPINSEAQAPSIQWEKCFGGSYYDEAQSMQQTPDGGYIVAGYTASTDGDVTGNHGRDDWWVVKLDSSGAVQWKKCFGGSNVDDGCSIVVTADHGYVVAGDVFSTDDEVSGNHGSPDYWVLKLDSTGNIQWQKCLGGAGAEEASYIRQTADGGFIVAGWSDSTNGEVTGNHGQEDYWIVKLSDTGAIQWQKSLGGSNNEYPNSIGECTDGGYIIAGTTWSNDGDVSGNHGQDDYWIVKINATGAIEWQKCMGGSSYDEAYSVEQTKDGGYAVAGYTLSVDGDVVGNHSDDYDYWIIKLDSLGTVEWKKCYGGTGSEIAQSIRQTVDGGYIIAGYGDSNDGDMTFVHGEPFYNYDYWILKLNDTGKIEWQQSYGGDSDDVAMSIVQTRDSGYVVAGNTQSIDGEVTGFHTSVFTGHNDDYWIVKLNKADTGVPPIKASQQDISIYPNPSHDVINIKGPLGICSEVRTIEGRIVTDCNSKSTIDISNLKPGIYLLSVFSAAGEIMKTEKITKQ